MPQLLCCSRMRSHSEYPLQPPCVRTTPSYMAIASILCASQALRGHQQPFMPITSSPCSLALRGSNWTCLLLRRAPPQLFAGGDSPQTPAPSWYPLGVPRVQIMPRYLYPVMSPGPGHDALGCTMHGSARCLGPRCMRPRCMGPRCLGPRCMGPRCMGL